MTGDDTHPASGVRKRCWTPDARRRNSRVMPFEPVTHEPIVEPGQARELARDLVVIPDRRVELVPNIGVIGGDHSVLVVETGMGPRNAEKVLAFASEYAKGRTLYLTTTHFHPEHAFGAQVFAGEATYLLNGAQARDLAVKFDGYLAMFRGLSPVVADRLQGVHAVEP